MRKTVLFGLYCLALFLAVISSVPIATGADTADSKKMSAPIINDVAISDAVKANIAADSVMEPVDIDVITEEGVVTLQGTVNNASQVERAGHIAINTPGVLKVDNELKVSH